MNHWLEGVRRVLARTPTGALAFSDLLEELRNEGLGIVPEPDRLLLALSERVDLFRVIRFSIGPWSRWARTSMEGGASPGVRPDPADPWILLLRTPEVGAGRADPVMRRIREGLVAWGRALDDASPASMARWLRASREGSRTWLALVSGLGRPA